MKRSNTKPVPYSASWLPRAKPQLASAAPGRERGVIFPGGKTLNKSCSRSYTGPSNAQGSPLTGSRGRTLRSSSQGLPETKKSWWSSWGRSFKTHSLQSLGARRGKGTGLRRVRSRGSGCLMNGLCPGCWEFTSILPAGWRAVPGCYSPSSPHLVFPSTVCLTRNPH